jgi:hypothetical protein
MLIVELKQYSDFGVEITQSVWYTDMYYNTSEFPLKTTMFENDADVANAVKALKELGFRKAKTAEITVGGNL